MKIIDVQTKACPAMFKAIEDNVLYGVFPKDPSICEALVGGIGKLSYKMAKECIDEDLMVKILNKY